MPNFISEDQIERALLQKLQHVHGYDILECGTAEREDLADGSGRADKREVFLLDRLRTAANMRAGLKHAQFLAFTGTPLLGREKKTNQWFGDYVSEYNFQQSMDDGATVPLYYQR